MRLLFEGGYYSRCGFYSNKYGSHAISYIPVHQFNFVQSDSFSVSATSVACINKSSLGFGCSGRGGVGGGLAGGDDLLIGCDSIGARIGNCIATDPGASCDCRAT